MDHPVVTLLSDKIDKVDGKVDGLIVKVDTLLVNKAKVDGGLIVIIFLVSGLFTFIGHLIK